MDDLESLIYTMWYVSGIHMVRDWKSLIAEGMLLNSCTKKEAVVKVLVCGFGIVALIHFSIFYFLLYIILYIFSAKVHTSQGSACLRRLQIHLR